MKRGPDNIEQYVVQKIAEAIKRQAMEDRKTLIHWYKLMLEYEDRLQVLKTCEFCKMPQKYMHCSCMCYKLRMCDLCRLKPEICCKFCPKDREDGRQVFCKECFETGWMRQCQFPECEAWGCYECMTSCKYCDRDSDMCPAHAEDSCCESDDEEEEEEDEEEENLEKEEK